MNHTHEDRKAAVSPARAKAGASASAGGKLKPARSTPSAERWQRMATGLRGGHLFRVFLPADGRVFWEAECVLNGNSVSKRFASELHARAWLSVATQLHPHFSAVEREELFRPASGSCFVSGA